jgi:spore maturation protein CgeB
MDINKFSSIGNGSKKIFFGWNIAITSELKKISSEKDLTIYYMTSEYFNYLSLNIPKVLTINGHKTPVGTLQKADSAEWYKKFGDDAVSFIIKNKIKNVVMPYFLFSDKYLKILRNNKVQLITHFADDPEDTYLITKNYAPKYDKVICHGVQFNKNITIQEKIKSFGVKNVRFMPIFPNPKHYDNKIINYKEKDIDIVYIGAIQWRKWKRLHQIYKKFPTFKLYGRYDPRKESGVIGWAYKFINLFYPLPKVEYLEESEVKKIYKRSKIGFNCHQKWGPSNSRTYELCLNGILQVTDNPKGHQRLFNVGKEICCYDNMTEAIQLIEYYLKNHKERIEIAKVGYKRAMKDYAYEKLFIEEVKFIFLQKKF